MHYHLEIIMPNVADVSAAVDQIMTPFSEGYSGEDASRTQFYDWYVIGGRWAGTKLENNIGNEKIAAFREKLQEMKITVSGLQAGKHSLNPVEQIPVVDALWREWFPESGINVCPLFAHSNDQYKEFLLGDICAIKEVPASLTAAMVIIAGTAWNDDTKLEAKHMTQESVWNGLNSEKTEWDGLVLSAINKYRDHIKNYKDEYRAKNSPTDDWISVTVDYHS